MARTNTRQVLMVILKNQKALEIEGRRFKDNVPNYRVLSSKELLLEGPITRHYNWPSKYEKPMAHQVVTADFMTRHRRGFIFNSIGTGKTLIIDWLIDFLQKEKEIKRALIVAPLSTLQAVHADELKESLPHLSFGVLYGSREKRLTELRKDRNVYIINFDGLKVLEDALAKRKDIDCVFIDEIAILRNKNTALWKTVNNLFGVHTNKMVWGLTGSPMPKAPTDCYSQAYLIRPDNLPQQKNWRTGQQEPKPFYKFRLSVMYQKNEWLWLPKEGWEAACYKVLQPSIRFARNECVDLPPCVVESRDVVMSSEQDTAYKQMVKQMKVDLGGRTITAVNEGIKLMKLLQIASGAMYDADRNIHLINCKNKLKVLKEIIDASCPSHVLIFVPFRSMLKYLQQELDKTYGKGLTAYVNATVLSNKRAEIYRRFTKGDLRFIVAIPSCTSHGLNLHIKCHTIVWWSPIDRYDIYEQACGRIDRTGQTEEMLIVQLQSAPVEKAMYAKLRSRENAQRILLSILNRK